MLRLQIGTQMVKYTCERCETAFDQKSHYTRHLQRKRPCKKDPQVEAQVNQILQETPTGLMFLRPYAAVKEHIDSVLNKDKSLFRTSNDEPTPLGCVEEMLASVPDSFWSQPDLRILDPCCGNGNFHVCIANILRMHGWSPKRICEALVFNDTNEERLQQVRHLFGESAQVTSRDFLETTEESSYDMVVMNPPYAKLMPDGSRASKNHGLSVPFLEKGLQLLRPGGFLVAIVPDSWMSLADRNHFCETLTQYQFHALNIHCAKTWFPKVGSSFTWFVVQKVPGTTPFPVSYLHAGTVHTGLVDSQQRPYIPLQYSRTIQSILAKTIDNDALPKYVVETSSDLHRYTKRDLIRDIEDETFRYRLIHTPKQMAWANRPHKYQEGWKVFLSTTDKYRAFADNCGMTQSIVFIRMETETAARQTCEILMHPLYVFLNNLCRYGNFNNIRILQKLPMCTTGDPYTEFHLTNDEIALISSS